MELKECQTSTAWVQALPTSYKQGVRPLVGMFSSLQSHFSSAPPLSSSHISTVPQQTFPHHTFTLVCLYSSNRGNTGEQN